MNGMMTDKQLKMHKKISLTHLYFNRFLAIRYATAFFLFINLYWTIFLLGSQSIVAIFPFSLFSLSALTAIEQVKLYRNHSNQLPYTLFFYRMLLLSCLVLLFALYSPLYQLFFPFIKNTQQVLNVLMSLLMTSLFISFLMLIKLNKIKHNQDKHFKRIQAYEEIIN